ncbi:MAG TPA: xanthine dehydrogenase family protein molybdopterin-binding subunit [Patescibacteria group bacterium]|nr:xanthine dehydrogenase family protein molybdopterin-binding subunit [Patescibacteria group bacterium]
MSGLLGVSVPRRDAPAKVTGAARYADDLVVEGAWFGLTVRSTEPHASLLGIDRDPAFDWSRAVVVTAADIPGENVVSLIHDDQPALVADVIRHHAEAVALVAAPDPATARAARAAITLRTTPLPPVLDPLASEKAFARYEISKGDLAAGFAEADFVLEGEYRTGPQEHIYIEPQAMIASLGEDGSIIVTGSLQCPYYVHAALARALALPIERVRVVQAETGGGFGGKEEYPSMLAIHAALLARAAGRPVRMTYDRHEDIVATTKRHPAVVRHRTGVAAGGRLVAQEIDIVMDAGAYATLSPVVLSRGTLHATGPYRCPNVRVRARAAMTNTVPAGAFRGFGAPQTEFAAEVHLARIAEAVGISSAEMRRRLAYREGDVTATGQVLRGSVAAVDVLERAEEASSFEEERGRAGHGRVRPGDRTASGVGLALGWHGAGFTGSGERTLASRAGIELTADGRIWTLTAQTEIGQGTATVLPQIAADVLGVPVEAVETAPLDTALVPNSGPTVASRTTMVVGGLLVEAAGKLRAEVEARTGGSFADTYRQDALTHGSTRIDVRFDGYPGIEWDQERYRGDAYPAYGWAAAVAFVDVDLDTGVVAVRRVVAVDDAGRIVNPVLAAGQVEGGTLQAVGFATIEEMQVADGRYRNDRLATYLIPTALDAPAIEAHFVEAPFSDAPHGAKGLGELPMDVGAPAVIDAIHHATGAWITELPATPARVLAAIRALEDERAHEPAEEAAP